MNKIQIKLDMHQTLHLVSRISGSFIEGTQGISQESLQELSFSVFFFVSTAIQKIPLVLEGTQHSDLATHTFQVPALILECKSREPEGNVRFTLQSSQEYNLF